MFFDSMRWHGILTSPCPPDLVFLLERRIRLKPLHLTDVERVINYGEDVRLKSQKRISPEYLLHFRLRTLMVSVGFRGSTEAFRAKIRSQHAVGMQTRKLVHYSGLLAVALSPGCFRAESASKFGSALAILKLKRHRG